MFKSKPSVFYYVNMLLYPIETIIIDVYSDICKYLFVSDFQRALMISIENI